MLSQDYVKQAIRNRECCGNIEHPESDKDYMTTLRESISHVVLSVTVEDGVPYGKFALANNQKGAAIKALTDLGVPVGVSTRGLGDILEDSVSKYVDESNYALITWDFTNDPNMPVVMNPISDSIRGTRQFQELVQLRHIVDSGEGSALTDYNKLKAEATVLINKLQDLFR